MAAVYVCAKLTSPGSKHIISLEGIVGMPDENIDKRIEFIIEQQAQFSVDINSLTSKLDRLSIKVDTLAEIQARAETRLNRVEESFVLVVQLAKIADERLDRIDMRLDRTDVRLDSFSEKMEMITEAQAKTDYQLAQQAEAQARTDKQLAELAEAQARTDGRLNTLVDVVERYISKGSNGKTRH